jgi:selenocysteine lyase/cysteine desulfurase
MGHVRLVPSSVGEPARSGSVVGCIMADRHGGGRRRDRPSTSGARDAGCEDGRMRANEAFLPVALVGDDLLVPCVDGVERTYANLDAAASTGALAAVETRVRDFLPWYSSVHRGAGYKSRRATRAYEDARGAMLEFAGRADRDDVVVICRNTTEAINHLAYRLRFAPDDVVLTTVVEHHANLLPWTRAARTRFVECASNGTFTVDDVIAALGEEPRPKLLAITGASNVTGWMPPIDAIAEAAHERGVPVFLDAAQLAPHRPLPTSVDFVAWSGHKMYAPFGAGALVGPRATFVEGDPFLAGGGAVDLVDLDEVVWSDPPEREEAGSPNVLGAVALHAAIDELTRIGWDRIVAHDVDLARHLRSGLARIPGVRLLGPDDDGAVLPLATFDVDGMHHALVAARLSAEYGIGVRHGCFCAHPYLLRLLELSTDEIAEYHRAVARGDRREIPGAVRASAGLSTSIADVDRLLAAVGELVAGKEAPIAYAQDLAGDFAPAETALGWSADEGGAGTPCASG